MQTVASAMREASALLEGVSDTARLDAELLMAEALGVSRSELLVRHQTAPVPPGFAPFLQRRLAAEPVAYILGRCEFFGLELGVTPAVLIPRGDSECVVEAALEACPAQGRVLDLGTGSGALLLAMLSQRPDLEGVGLDASHSALEVARGNAARLGLSNRAVFLQRDWTDDDWAAKLGTFDCVISNPPYVEADAKLERSVRDFEPAAALFAGADGLDAYRALVPRLRDLLDGAARAVLEIGCEQADSVGALARTAGFCVIVRNDLAGRPRALVLS
ncbi:MAG: peptide chain release factor N(5)-glutamine methyltransferase [Erythrobacter sp.]|jgi:release factor glutamine methyltransferase|nr:peptide chain release factor N(5)-glutamine methyltransferase [Erythrobacter sp.]